MADSSADKVKSLSDRTATVFAGVSAISIALGSIFIL